MFVLRNLWRYCGTVMANSAKQKEMVSAVVRMGVKQRFVVNDWSFPDHQISK